MPLTGPDRPAASTTGGIYFRAFYKVLSRFPPKKTRKLLFKFEKVKHLFCPSTLLLKIFLENQYFPVFANISHSHKRFQRRPKRQFRETNGGCGGGGGAGETGPSANERADRELSANEKPAWLRVLLPLADPSSEGTELAEAANFSNLLFLFLYSCFITFFKLNYIFWYLIPLVAWLQIVPVLSSHHPTITMMSNRIPRNNLWWVIKRFMALGHVTSPRSCYLLSYLRRRKCQKVKVAYLWWRPLLLILSGIPVLDWLPGGNIL